MLRKSIGRGASYKFQTFGSIAQEPQANKVQKEQNHSNHFKEDSKEETEISQQMLDYYIAQNKLLEDFFIIGVNDEDLKRIEQGQINSSVNGHEIINMKSRMLYTHSNNAECQRRKVVKDFCFPYPADEQIKLIKLTDANEIHEILYGQYGSLRKNAFIFHMQADDMGNKEYSTENIFHCLCVITYDVVKIPKSAKTRRMSAKGAGVDLHSKPDYEYYKCPKAYVIMSQHPFFNLFLDFVA